MNKSHLTGTPIRIIILYSQSIENSTLSYQHGWPKAFLESPLFSCIPINLAKMSIGDCLSIAKLLHKGRFEAILLLHSVFSNQQNLGGMLFWILVACRAPKVFFIGNEYKLMPEKMHFCRRLGITLLVTQSNDERIHALYKEALGCHVICVPNTGFDPLTFSPKIALAKRSIDIGYRSYPSPWYLGNNEKVEIAECFAENAERLGLSVDISLDPLKRFDTVGYASFLNNCRAQIGTESGGDYFELTDNTRIRINSYSNEYPETSWLEIKQLFFDGYKPSLPLRIISGRQVEAAACKTVQILFEGRYNDYFEPDVHFIPLRKDFSNIDEAVDKLKDSEFCSRLTEAAFDVAMSKLTYKALIEKFHKTLQNIL